MFYITQTAFVFHLKHFSGSQLNCSNYDLLFFESCQKFKQRTLNIGGISKGKKIRFNYKKCILHTYKITLKCWNNLRTFIQFDNREQIQQGFNNQNNQSENTVSRVCCMVTCILRKIYFCVYANHTSGLRCRPACKPRPMKTELHKNITDKI